MKGMTVVEQIERLEDQLQVLKWTVRLPAPRGRTSHLGGPSVVSQTAGLLRGRLPRGVTYQRRLRGEWESRLKREIS